MRLVWIAAARLVAMTSIENSWSAGASVWGDRGKLYQPPFEPGIGVLTPSRLVKSLAADEVERIEGEPRELFSDADGRLDLEALARLAAPCEQPAVDDGLLDV
jgi:hypothetical protein